MGVNEKDPRDIQYLALFIAITWYRQIPSDAAIRIAQGRSSAKPGRKPTPEILEQVEKIIDSPNFRNFNSIEKKYRVNRYDIITSEEEFAMSQIEMSIKRLRLLAAECSGGDCDKCLLDSVMCGESTLCEVLMDIEIDKKGKPVTVGNRGLQKTAINCNLEGEAKTRGFEVYKSVLDEFGKYMDENKDKKIRDIVSRALLEYMERHR